MVNWINYGCYLDIMDALSLSFDGIYFPTPTLRPVPLMTTLIGDRGSGKGTFTCLEAQMVKEYYPWIKRVANTHIHGTIFIENILKWIATKLIVQDRTYTEIWIDEAALAGLESRGSFQESRALDSYLFTLSRKVNANIRLVTQLISMIEKRAQWVGDYFILCEAKYLPDGETIEKFVYKVHDGRFRKINELELNGELARQYIFPRFRSEEIPFQEELSQKFMRYYEIDENDIRWFKEMMKP